VPNTALGDNVSSLYSAHSQPVRPLFQGQTSFLCRSKKLGSPPSHKRSGSEGAVTVAAEQLPVNPGQAGFVELRVQETERRWQETTSPWPIMQAGTYDISRDRMMARPKANHIQFAYACSPQEVDRAGWIQASIANAPGKAKHPGKESRVLWLTPRRQAAESLKSGPLSIEGNPLPLRRKSTRIGGLIDFRSPAR